MLSTADPAEHVRPTGPDGTEDKSGMRDKGLL
jgi:hypothetical protein